MNQRLNQRLSRAVFWALLAVVVTLSLVPAEQLPPQAFTLWDKAQHALAFAALGASGLWAYPRSGARVLLGLVLCGAAIELAQAASGWRFGDWQDWFADTVGLAAGAALAWAVRRLQR